MQKILVWLSGWVDSAVTAYLLKEQWYDVTAGFMINYISDDGNCPTKKDLEEAKKVAEFLWINFFSFDYQKEYNDKIIQYIFDGYRQWYTPNPDILCNSKIKFDLFLQEAINLGFDAIATGHYARIVESDWLYRLFKWKDQVKDQSYFLAWLKQWQLSKALFPIWSLEKSEVRQIAKKAWLPNADRKDSQWLCFIGNVDMKEFLKKELPEKKWYTVDREWNILWEHNWVWFYTIWQRRWLGIWWNKAYFVIQKDLENNNLIVWDEEELALFSKSLTANNWHCISDELQLPQKWYARIRHWQSLQSSEVFDLWDFRIKVEFENSQRAIASGQIVAFYQGEELVASAVIE